ncbi:MAG: dgkA [Rhodocyclaceae bacterium]|nr:dgkA [Rhodocyclaceae bacterium]
MSPEDRSRPDAQAPGGDSPFKGRRGLARVWNALHYSLAGLKVAYAGEAAFRQEVWLAAPLVAIACLLPVDGSERALLLGSVFLVLIVELVNSAIEAVVDRIGPERHPLSGRAKDVGSAAVLVALVNAAAIWACVLAPKL